MTQLRVSAQFVGFLFFAKTSTMCKKTQTVSGLSLGSRAAHGVYFSVARRSRKKSGKETRNGSLGSSTLAGTKEMEYDTKFRTWH